ncbi:hypothetical protein [Gilvibacter sediminis]|uniref:hypothetical protein n=1 Tax=Gilvibacter sediminis TaxID=379071 RepID=UPI00234FF15C|nr:hypothetical protein [Gilvibacter sediminis]MDC7996951.1 hypothetical protein [Gilvibacter sediminis]
MKKLITLGLLGLFPVLSFGQSSSSTNSFQLIESEPIIEVVHADFDQDGKLERITLTKERLSSVATISYQDNDGSDPKTIGIITIDSADEFFIIKTDADKDSDLDIVIAAQNSNSLQAETSLYKFINEGDGKFKSQTGL